MIQVFTTGKSGSTSCAEWLRLGHEKHHPRGTVAWWNIFNLDYWLKQDVTRILLIRDREDFVKSYMNRGVVRLMQLFLPQFNFATESGLRDYWDWYNDTCLAHEDKFIVIGTEQIPIVRNRSK